MTKIRLDSSGRESWWSPFVEFWGGAFVGQIPCSDLLALDNLWPKYSVEIETTRQRAHEGSSKSWYHKSLKEFCIVSRLQPEFYLLDLCENFLVAVY